MWKPIIMAEVDSRMASSSSHSSSSVSTLVTTGSGFVGILMYQSLAALLHPGESTTSGTLGFECFQPFLDLSGKLYISKHVMGQFRLIIPVAPFKIQGPLFPKV